MQRPQIAPLPRAARGVAIAALAACLAASPGALGQQELWRLEGEQHLEGVGFSATFLDDLDGDGVRDYAFGGVRLAYRDEEQFGAVHIHSGATHARLRSITGLGDESFGTTLADGGDFDGDGRGDLLVGAPASGDGELFVVSAATGAPLARFLPPTGFSDFGRALVALGDLDGDAIPDFVAGDRDAVRTPALHWISGASGAVLGRTVALAERHLLVDADDCDGDGVRDLLVIVSDNVDSTGLELRMTAWSGATRAALWSTRVRDGAFVIQDDFSACALDDFDGDGRRDLLLCSAVTMQTGPAAAWISIHAAADGSALLEKIDADVGRGFGRRCCAVGDLDGDGKSDFAMSRLKELDIVSSATLKSLARRRVTNGDARVLAGAADLDGDGRVELLLGDSFEQPTGIVRILTAANLRLRAAQFGSAEQLYSLEGVALHDDVDGDAIAELLVARRDALDGTGGHHVAVLAGSDGRELARHALGSLGYGTGPLLSLPDVDGDGRGDYAITGLDLVDVRSGATGGLLHRFASPLSGTRFGAALAVQAQPSGTLHLAIGDPEGGTAGTDAGAVELRDLATGALLIRKNGPTFGERYGSALAALGDVNGDGTADWAIGSPTRSRVGFAFAGRVVVASGIDLSLIAALNGALATDQLGSGLAALGDVDGDGIADLLAGAPGGGIGSNDSGTLLVLSGATLGTLVTATGREVADPIGHELSASPDANGDGHAELLALAASGDHFELFDGATGAFLTRFPVPWRIRRFATAPSRLAGLAGPGGGPLLAATSPGRLQASFALGLTQLLELDDLWLVVNPDHAPAGATVTAHVRGGPIGAATSLALVAIDGVPLFATLDAGVLDGLQHYGASGVVPVGLAGTTWTLRASAQGFSGATIDSNEALLTFE